MGNKMDYGLIGMRMESRKEKTLTRMGNSLIQYVGIDMGMNVNVVNMVVVNNPHPKDLSKSPAFVGFFVCGIGRTLD